MINFNVPPFIGSELKFIQQVVDTRKICGDGPFTKKCNAWLENRFKTQKALLTTSGTTALEMSALMCNFQEDDEVILPSYTFSSTANAFVLAGAKLVFVDIRPDTLNIDEKKIEKAISSKAKAICVVHYAGVACEMDTIMEIANRYSLRVIEDAAQAVMSTYKGRALGSLGDFGCFSFHETKNYSMGEGGAILIKEAANNEKAEILREKGTDRSKFFRGQIDKYTWVDYGSSYLPSELNAAYLWAQLEQADMINNNRLSIWNTYMEAFQPLSDNNLVELPYVPAECAHNAHMFYLKCKNLQERTAFIEYMKEKGILCVFHYIPLHSSSAGKRFGSFNGFDEYTTNESERVVRLPMFYGLPKTDQEKIIEATVAFFKDNK